MSKKKFGGTECPVCSADYEQLEIRNCGFVNCEWNMRGILRKSKESKIYSDGKTYDGKLYTFKECDIKTVWMDLNILVKSQDQKNMVRNLPTPVHTNTNREKSPQKKKAI